MKKAITILVSLFTAGAFAQAPQKMTYQAVIRNSSNMLVAGAAVGVRVSILQGSASGTEVYKEIFNPNPSTNANGLVTIEIGSGIPLTGTFATINWANGPYYIKTETDPAGGTNYTISGTSQLLSVPYAFYSASGGTTYKPGMGVNITNDTITNTAPDKTVAINSGTGINVGGTYPNFTITNTAPDQAVSLNGSGEISVTGTYPNFTISSSGGVIVLNSGNYLSTTVPANSIINIQGTISLSSTYSMGLSNLFITGGTFDGGSGQTLNCGNYAVFSGVNFNNIIVNSGLNVSFINCRFTNVTQLPLGCSLTGCQISGSTFTTVSSIGYINNCSLSNSTIPRISRICNSLISGCTIGDATNYTPVVAGNQISNSSVIYISNTFTGNNCDNARVLGAFSSSRAINISGNTFGAFSLTTNIIQIDVSVNGTPYSAIISNNIFEGNSTSPVGQHILITGTYQSTRSIVKISNNTAFGGSGIPFITFNATASNGPNGSLACTVNDNDYNLSGGLTLGVTNGGYITERNNVGH